MMLGATVGYAQTPILPIPVSGHTKVPSGSAPTRPNVCFTLTGYKPAVPKIIGNTVLLNATNFCVTPAADGSFTTNLYGNDVISPDGTTWRVDFNRNSSQESSATYRIVGTSFNLDTAVPITTPPESNTLIFGSKTYVFYQPTPVLTWVIPHGFGDKNVQVQCRDLTDHVLIPDTITLTDHNTVTVGFFIAQAGTCIAMSAGNNTFTTVVGDAVVKNPNATQTMNTQNLILTGPVYEKILNSSTVFADQFTGADASAKLQSAILALPASGGVIDATNLTDLGGGGSTVIDPGTRAVTIKLGPTTYHLSQIMLRDGLTLLGSRSTSASTGTFITATNGSIPLVVIPQTNDLPAQHVFMSGLQFIGATGNTAQDGFFIDSSSNTNSGLWYSTFDDIVVQGFNGVGIRLRGRPNDSLSNNQFLQFRNVQVFRPAATAGPALKIEGANSNITFLGGEFDGVSQDHVAGSENIYVGQYSGGGVNASDIQFIDTTVQNANVGVELSGAWHVTFTHMHHEALNGAYLLTLGGAQNNSITLQDSWFAGEVGVDSGNGYIVNTANSGTGALAMSILRNTYGVGAAAPVDHFVIGGTSTSGQALTVADNMDYASGQTGVPDTVGVTQLLAITSATLDLRRYHSVLVQPSATVVTTIKSWLAAGEFVTIRANSGGGTVSLGNGGNIDIGQIETPLVLKAGDTVTLTRDDITGFWVIVGRNGTSLAPSTTVTAVAGGSSGVIPLLVASSNTAMGTAAIGSGACATTVTVTTTGALSTDNLIWNYATTPVGSNHEYLKMNAWTEAGNIKFAVCNPTAGSLTPAGMTINWRLIRH